MEGQAPLFDSATRSPEVLLEGKLLKLSRNKVWQERHFCFSSEHILSYSHAKEDYLEPNAAYRITRDAGCKISDLYVEQRLKAARKESLYCMTLTWGETCDDSTIDQGSIFGADAAYSSTASQGINPMSPSNDLYDNKSNGSNRDGITPMKKVKHQVIK